MLWWPLVWLMAMLLVVGPGAHAAPPEGTGLEASVRVLRDALERVAAQRGQDRREVLARIDGLLDEASKNPESASARLSAAYALVRSEIRLLAQEQNAPRADEPRAGSPAATQRSYERVRDSAGALRDALQRLSQEAGRQAAAEQVATVDRLLAEAASEAGAAQWSAAQHTATQAMDFARAAIRQIREGTTQVRSLVFATPADEYRYELERYASYRLLFDATVAREAVTDAVASRRQEAETRLALADAEAKQGNYTKAVTLLEEAAQRWIAAMRAAGVYLPG
jgi:hypothetical protein